MQAVSGQLCHDGVLFNRSIANDTNRAPYVDHGGWPPAGSRSSVNDEIDLVAEAVPDFFGRRGRWHVFTICAGAGHRPDSTQEILQWRGGGGEGARRAPSPRDRRG